MNSLPKGLKSAGFTLIELLVVVFLIGLISGLAVLSVSSRGDSRTLEESLEGLRYRLLLAGEEAIVQGRPVGIVFDRDQYQFLIAGADEWKPLTTKALKQDKLGPDWAFELSVEGQPVQPGKASSDHEEEKPQPQLVFYPTGEVTLFEILIIDEVSAPKYRILYDESGVIALEAVNES